MVNVRNKIYKLGLMVSGFLAPIGTIFASMAQKSPSPSGQILMAGQISEITEVDCDEDVCDVLACFYEDFQRRQANRTRPQLFFVFTDVDDTLFEATADQDYLIEEWADIAENWEEDGYKNKIYPGLSKKVLLKETIQQLNEYMQEDPSFKVVALTHQRFWNPVTSFRGDLILKNIECCEGWEEGPTYNGVRIGALKHIGLNLSKDFLNGNQFALKPVLDDIQLLQSDLNALEQRNPKIGRLNSSADVRSYQNLSLFELPNKRRFDEKYPTPYLVAQGSTAKDFREMIAFPVCEQGMVVCNFSERGVQDPKHTERKGDIMWSYLETYLEQNFGTDSIRWPKVTVVGIDDQRSMLENMRAVCARKGIDFSGIYFHRKRSNSHRW